MATQKRRVIYLSDEEWEAAKRQAEPFNMTASAYIRLLVAGGRIIPIVEETRPNGDRIAYAAPQPEPSFLRDEVMRLKRELAAAHSPGFNSRPFTPVPKKGK